MKKAAGLWILISVFIGLWARPCLAATFTVLDTFSTQSYSNQDGTANWIADWVEVNDNNAPDSGWISIPLDSGHLRIRGNRSDALEIRRSVDLSLATSAVLSFDYERRRFNSWQDSLTVQISSDGGGTWNTLVTINTESAMSGSWSGDISAYLSADTWIRFVGTDTLAQNEQVFLDNVRIDYVVPELVAYYALEGDVADSSGNGHDGGAQGTTDYQPAMVCDGVQLDGSGYLQVPDNGGFDLPDALTVMAWIRPDSLSVPDHTEGLYSFLSKDTNFEFHVRSDGSLYWWWSDGSLATGAGLVPVGTWTHVAFVYSRAAGNLQIYVNGSQAANQSYSDPMPLNNDPFYIGTDKTTGGGELPQRRFYGGIDEVRVYDGALPQAEITTLMNTANPCAVAIDHYEIVHDGSALTCAPEAVTVRACVDPGCTALYDQDVVIDLSPAGWVGGDQQTLTGGSGIFRLRHTTPETVTLSVSSLSPAAANPPLCVDGSGGSSCELTFHEAGFIFDVADLTSCTLEQNIRIAAVRADATAEQCVGDDSFANTTRNVNFWSSYQEPATGTRPVLVNGSAVAVASPGTAVQLAFDAQAESLLSVQYNDAGRVGLSARFEGSGDEAGLVMIGGDSFVAVPDHLQVTATTNGTTLLDNTTPFGDPHWPAGQNFFVAVSGVCADDSVTPNFAATTTFTATAANPAPGGFSGGPLTVADYTGGTATGTAAYSEVGTVTLQAQAADYLGSGVDVVGSTVIGRFTPFQFAVALNTPAFAPGCPTGGFTYIGQPFTYATAPEITVTAQNMSGNTTVNYTGVWWKITNATLTGKTYAADHGTLDLSGIPAVDPVISDDGGGVGRLTFGDGGVSGGISFQRNAPEVPFNAEISLSINVLDEDGIAATANPVKFGDATAGNGIAFTGSAKQMRWGRLVLENAYGSELVALSMPFRAEFFNGASAFATNIQDDCTGVALNQLTLNNGSGSVTADNPIQVGAGNSSTTLLNIPFAAGDAGLQFSAPGSQGYIDVDVDLSTLPWLEYDWNGDGSQEGPSARATFGIHQGRPHIIYLREIFR
jgi:MSHA biogenesis protein MshQ